MIKALTHIAVAVPDLDAAILQFRTLYGVEAGPTHVNAEQKVKLAYLDFGSCRIELISPTDDVSPIAGFLKRSPGGGLHHVCLSTDDLDESMRTIALHGGSIIGGGAKRNYAGGRIAFVHPRTTCGVLVELSEESPPD